jgi:hypothetical protein
VQRANCLSTSVPVLVVTRSYLKNSRLCVCIILYNSTVQYDTTVLYTVPYSTVLYSTVDGSSGAPLPLAVSLNAAVSASSGACPAQPTVRELPVPALRLVAPLGGMRGSSGHSASPAPALGADRAGIG